MAQRELRHDLCTAMLSTAKAEKRRVTDYTAPENKTPGPTAASAITGFLKATYLVRGERS